MQKVTAKDTHISKTCRATDFRTPALVSCIGHNSHSNFLQAAIRRAR